MTKEVITLQVGQCGIQFGHEFWKQICMEHGINPNGTITKKDPDDFFGKKDIFFYESSNNKYTPRAILFDLEPRLFSNFFNSNFNFLYRKKNILSSKQGTGNNWSNGYHQAIGYQFEIEEILRKESEKCDQLSSFNIFHSIVGGTGSGFGSLSLEIIRDEFPGKFIKCSSVIPNQFEISDVVVQPYNSILTMRWLSLYSDCVTFFENDSIQKIIDSQNKKTKISLRQIDTIMAKVLSVLTLPIRYSNCLNSDFESIFAPLIPTPNLHFFFAGISDYNFPGKKKTQHSSVAELIRQTFNNRTINSNLREGKLVSSLCCSNFESRKVEFSSKFKKIFLENQIRCIDWAPVSIQFSFPSRLKKEDKFRKEGVCLFNHTCVKSLFKKTLKHYNMLKKRNAFLNSYLKEFSLEEGLELFDDSKETLENLLKEYKNAESKNFLND